jgi:type VI secretion system protein ImpE
VATQDPKQLLAEGKLSEALAAVQAGIRANAADPGRRVFLFQLLCLTGQWERAMGQLNALADLDPSPATTLTIRAGAAAVQAEVVRGGVFRGERDPVVFGEPAEWVGWMVHANRLLATGQVAAADDLRARALEQAPAVPGTINGQPFDWIADADGRFGPILEAIIEGRYYWVPWHQVRAVTVDPPQALRDLVWTPAHFTWANGGETVGLIPTRYPGSEDVADPLACLARRTDWTSRGSAECGRGQRMFATDRDDYPILETRSITLDLPPGDAEPGAAAAEGSA